MNDASDNKAIPGEQPDASSEVVSVQSKSEPAEPEELTGWAAVYDFVMQSYCWTVIFFGLYVLSLGPFYSAWRNAVDMGEKPVLQAVYLPLAALCSKSETLSTIVEWYVGLWS